MEVWLLGVGALLLIALTVWIVWPTSGTPAADSAPADEFDDRYTSATADLSAGGVAVTVQEEAAGVVPPASTIAAEPLENVEPLREPEPPPPVVVAPPERARATREPKAKVGIATAAVLAVASAIGGAWIYARWRRERDKPTRRLRRKFIK